MKAVIAGGGTGGHLMPALALAEALQAARPGLEVVLVGARRGVEASILPRRPFRHHLLSAEPLYRRTWWRNARWPLLVWRVLRECRRVLDLEQPAFVVGTGGYAAGPMLFSAMRRRLPIALQEQNAVPGITTRWLARSSRQIHLGFPEARQYLHPGPNTQIFTLGNPIRPPSTATRSNARRLLQLPDGMPVLLVVGGSQGARALNRAVSEMLESGGLDGIALLWSTGQSNFDELKRHHRPPLTQVLPFWDPIDRAYGAADLLLSRSGAMTVAELCAWALPSILVPYPAAAAQHQTHNALALSQAGAAYHLPESELTAKGLSGLVRDLIFSPARLNSMAAAARARGQPDAAARIATTILEGLT